MQNIPPINTFQLNKLLVVILKLQRKYISLSTMIFSLVLCRKNLYPQHTIWHFKKVFKLFIDSIHREKCTSCKGITKWTFKNWVHLCLQPSSQARDYFQHFRCPPFRYSIPTQSKCNLYLDVKYHNLILPIFNTLYTWNCIVQCNIFKQKAMCSKSRFIPNTIYELSEPSTDVLKCMQVLLKGMCISGAAD